MPVKPLPCSPASLGHRALVHMAIFSPSDLTPNNTCESAWQGASPPHFRKEQTEMSRKICSSMDTEWSDLSQLLLLSVVAM